MESEQPLTALGIDKKDEIEARVRTKLDLIKALFLHKVERLKDDEDGEFYYKIRDHISKADIDAADSLLIDVAKIYRDAGLKNRNKYYRKMSRMTAYIYMDYVPCTLDELLTELDTHERKGE